MSNYDDGYLGVENSQHPANEIELDIDDKEISIPEWWYNELLENTKELKKLKSCQKDI